MRIRGAVLRESNRRRLREGGRVIYLRSSPEELHRRLRHDTQRPLLQVADPLERLLDETDEYCRSHPEREDGEAMFKRIKDRRHALRKVLA